MRTFTLIDSYEKSSQVQKHVLEIELSLLLIFILLKNIVK